MLENSFNSSDFSIDKKQSPEMDSEVNGQKVFIHEMMKDVKGLPPMQIYSNSKINIEGSNLNWNLITYNILERQNLEQKILQQKYIQQQKNNLNTSFQNMKFINEWKKDNLNHYNYRRNSCQGELFGIESKRIKKLNYKVGYQTIINQHVQEENLVKNRRQGIWWRMKSILLKHTELTRTINFWRKEVKMKKLQKQSIIAGQQKINYIYDINKSNRKLSWVISEYNENRRKGLHYRESNVSNGKVKKLELNKDKQFINTQNPAYGIKQISNFYQKQDDASFSDYSGPSSIQEIPLQKPSSQPKKHKYCQLNENKPNIYSQYVKQRYEECKMRQKKSKKYMKGALSCYEEQLKTKQQISQQLPIIQNKLKSFHRQLKTHGSISTSTFNNSEKQRLNQSPKFDKIDEVTKVPNKLKQILIKCPTFSNTYLNFQNIKENGSKRFLRKVFDYQ